jgi:hypothetical protein
MDAIGSREIAPGDEPAHRNVGRRLEGDGMAVVAREAMEDQKYRGTLSMCSRRVDAGPVSAVTILPAVNKRSMAARKDPRIRRSTRVADQFKRGALRSIRV